jgi:hypothetical protein
MGDKIDMCTVSTPDHAHYPAAMEAIKRGKHVCVQKPLVNRIWEANELHEAAKKKGVKTNMGNQGHTGKGIRFLKQWMSEGIVGNVKEIHVWTNRPIWPQGNAAKDKYTGNRPKVQGENEAAGRRSLGQAPGCELAAMARPGARSSLHQRPAPLRLARSSRVRRRCHGRHGLPHARRSLLGLRTWRTLQDGSRSAMNSPM